MRLQGAFFVFWGNFIMAWITLFPTGALEVCWSTFLKLSEGFARPGWTVLAVGAAVFREPMSALRLLFAALLLSGIVGLKATSA